VYAASFHNGLQLRLSVVVASQDAANIQHQSQLVHCRAAVMCIHYHRNH